jgi:large subunit ribosomal protein L9
MSKETEVLLTKDVQGLGKLGAQKKVKGGYFRNFLFPQKLAILNTPENKKTFEILKKKEMKRQAQELADANAIKQALDGKAICIKKKAQEEGRLYGSVSVNDIVNDIQSKFNIKLETKCIKMPASLKEVGSFDIDINIHSEVTFQIKLTIEALEEA